MSRQKMPKHTEEDPAPDHPADRAEIGRRLHLVARRMNETIYRHNLPAGILPPLRRALRHPACLLGREVAMGHPCDLSDLWLPATHVLIAHATLSRTDQPGCALGRWRMAAPLGAAVEFAALADTLNEELGLGNCPHAQACGEWVTLQIILILTALAQHALHHPQVPPTLAAPLAEAFALASSRGAFLLHQASLINQRPSHGGELLETLAQHRALITQLALKVGMQVAIETSGNPSTLPDTANKSPLPVIDQAEGSPDSLVIQWANDLGLALGQWRLSAAPSHPAETHEGRTRARPAHRFVQTNLGCFPSDWNEQVVGVRERARHLAARVVANIQRRTAAGWPGATGWVGAAGWPGAAECRWLSWIMQEEVLAYAQRL